MRNFDEEKQSGRRGSLGLSGLGGALVLMVAYVISHKDAPVKPASGSAQALALASSKSSAR